jgi:uncharacterized protein
MRLALFLLLVGCSRVPDEPTPIVKPSTDKTVATTAAPTATPTTTVIKPCPPDPDPGLNKTLYKHGKASFVTPDGKTHTFDVEIAATDDAQQRGLMYRTSLAEDAGMVFEFAQVHHAQFWMHNTCIPLDMVFVSEDKLVIGVITAPPLNEEGRGVPGLSKYVVELAAGVAKKRGIAIGTKFVPPT